MKALVCEMCNSSDIVKQDGNFVCQSCGMKYTLEEAKKMMVEGTVKVDNSEFVQKYLQNARRAKQKEDWEETEKYYNLVEQNDPSNIEAIFYSAYGKARACLCVNEIFKREAIFKALTNSISILDDNYDAENSEELEPVIEQIVTDILDLYNSRFVYTETTNGNGQKSNDKHKTYQLFIDAIDAMQESLGNIIEKLSDKKNKVFIYKQQVKLLSFVAMGYAHVTDGTVLRYCDLAITATDNIKSLDSSYDGQDFRSIKENRLKAIKKAERSNKIGCTVTILLVLAVIAFFVVWIASEL